MMVKFGFAKSVAELQSKLVKRQHVEIHMNDLSFPCNECDESFQTRKKLAYHMQKIHLGGWYYSCSECFTNYGSRERLKRHFIKKHNGQ